MNAILNAWYRNRQLPAGNPLANALVIIAGTLLIAVSLVLGFFAFIVLGSLIAIMAAIVGIRLWWFRRKLRRGQGREPGGSHRADVIEGEYRVVSRRRDDEQA